jgi:hypothetical protein
MANDAIDVVLDLVACKARMLCKGTILALPAQSQGQDMLTTSNSVATLSQLVISESCKINILAKADGSISGCSVVLPGGVEFNIILPDKIKKALVSAESKLKKSTVIKGPHYLPEEDPIHVQPIWTARNKKITKVYYRKNRAPMSLAPHISQVFDASSFMKETKSTRTPLKRNATLVVDQELRRSKRIMSTNKG